MANLHESVLIDGGYDELSPLDFYKELFSYTNGYLKYGEGLLLPVTFSDEGDGTWRSIALGDLEVACGHRNDAYVSCCTYFPTKTKDGKWRATNIKERADQLVAFVLDLDDGFPDNLYAALNEWWPKGVIPEPTFVVCSGNGLHLYYVLQEPVPMMKRWLRELGFINNYLYNLYQPRKEHAWDEWEIAIGQIDRHGLTQPYRVVGSLVKNGDDTVSAWRVGSTYSIRELAEIAGLNQTDFTEDGFDMAESLLTAEIKRSAERKAKYNADGRKRKGWNPGFYKWLAKRELDRSRLYGEYGHRYNQVVSLAIAARKDRIPREQLVQDVKAIHAGWDRCAKKYGHPEITWAECQKAMRTYDQNGDMHKFPKWWLEEKCGFEFGTQKRNGRPQAVHLNRARKLKFDYAEGGDPVALGGRPKGSGTKAKLIRDYAHEHPEANHSQIARALGVSRPTVIKWLKDKETWK